MGNDRWLAAGGGSRGAFRRMQVQSAALAYAAVTLEASLREQPLGRVREVIG